MRPVVETPHVPPSFAQGRQKNSKPPDQLTPEAQQPLRRPSIYVLLRATLQHDRETSPPLHTPLRAWHRPSPVHCAVSLSGSGSENIPFRGQGAQCTKIRDSVFTDCCAPSPLPLSRLFSPSSTQAREATATRQQQESRPSSKASVWGEVGVWMCLCACRHWCGPLLSLLTRRLFAHLGGDEQSLWASQHVADTTCFNSPRG